MYEYDVLKLILRFVLSLWLSIATMIFKAFPTIIHSSTLVSKPRAVNPRCLCVLNNRDHLSLLRLTVHQSRAAEIQILQWCVFRPRSRLLSQSQKYGCDKNCDIQWHSMRPMLSMKSMPNDTWRSCANDAQAPSLSRLYGNADCLRRHKQCNQSLPSSQSNDTAGLLWPAYLARSELCRLVSNAM